MNEEERILQTSPVSKHSHWLCKMLVLFKWDKGTKWNVAMMGLKVALDSPNLHSLSFIQ